MARARFKSIRTRLTVLSLLVILAPIGGALALVASRDLRDIRNEVVASSLLVGYVVSEYSASAMTFEDRKAAEQALNGLANVPNVITAALYDNAGRKFAAYSAAPHGGAITAPATIGAVPATRTAMDTDHVLVLQPVRSHGAHYGTLALWVAAAPLRSRTRAYLLSLAFLGLGILIAALALALTLERLISRPLLALTRVARTIAETENYAVRAERTGSDEIGLLGGAFNQMLVEVDRRQQQAKEAVQVRDDFLSVASHELKTPLTSLKLQVQGLLMMPPKVSDADAERMRNSLSVIQRQTSRLDKLIANLLDVSRIAAGRMALDLGTVDLAAIVSDAIAHFEPELKRQHYELERHIEGPVVGCWDPMRLDQVVTNLLSNAIKYGGGKPIEVRVERAGDRAKLIVRDHGIGIADTDQSRIFDRFERAVSLSYGGLGLGLYISRQIVLAHGGSVRVDSAPGVGSTFTVELPAAGAEALA